MAIKIALDRLELRQKLCNSYKPGSRSRTFLHHSAILRQKPFLMGRSRLAGCTKHNSSGFGATLSNREISSDSQDHAVENAEQPAKSIISCPFPLAVLSSLGNGCMPTDATRSR
jgi:hypothetical protein